MSVLPKKGDVIRCDSKFGCAPFTTGCEYTIEHIDRKIGHVYVYGDDGNLEAIDFPHDVIHGKFSKVG